MSGYDIARFIEALYWVYFAFIFVRVMFSWVGLPSNKTVIVIFKIVYDVTEPYLRIFRRLIGPAGGIDFSPFVAILVLYVVKSVLQGLVLSSF